MCVSLCEVIHYHVSATERTKQEDTLFPDNFLISYPDLLRGVVQMDSLKHPSILPINYVFFPSNDSLMF